MRPENSRGRPSGTRGPPRSGDRRDQSGYRGAPSGDRWDRSESYGGRGGRGGRPSGAMKRKARKESRQRAEKEGRYTPERAQEPRPGPSSRPSPRRSEDRSASRQRGESRSSRPQESRNTQKSGWEASLRDIRKIPFVGEVSLEAIRANLATPKVNQADLMMREPHKCTAEDVRTLVQESRDHGWITMTQQGHGRFLLLCSPVGNVVVLHSATRAYKVPDTGAPVVRQVCAQSVH
jgi:hypothetical protein